MAHVEGDINYGEFKALPYLTGLSLIWIYVGAVRSWILPSLSNYLYFAHLPFLIALWVQSRKSKSGQFGIISVFMLVLAVFQSTHFMLGNVDLLGGIYGLITYETPLIFIIIYNRIQICNRDLTRLVHSWLSTLPVNLIVVYFQVVKQSPSLQKVQFTETSLLGTSNGILRATGTFTSSAGFSYYIIFIFIVLFISFKRNFIRAPLAIGSATILLVLILLSGSRTILFFILLNLIVLTLTRDKSNNLAERSIKFTIFSMMLTTFIVLTTSNLKVVNAFFQRISIASKTENTQQRVLNAVIEPFKQFSDWSILGHGLGVYGHGSLGYNSSLWVENDLSKNVIECGVVIGSLVIFARLIIAIKFILLAKQNWTSRRTESLMVAVTYVPIIIAGQVTNQGSLLLGLCISTILVVKLLHSKKDFVDPKL